MGELYQLWRFLAMPAVMALDSSVTDVREFRKKQGTDPEERGIEWKSIGDCAACGAARGLAVRMLAAPRSRKRKGNMIPSFRGRILQ